MNAPRSPRQWVDTIMAQAFGVPRDPRSDEYKAGVRAVLELRFRQRHIVCPHPVGTASADAFFAGTNEGHRLWREHIEAHKGAA